MQVYCPRCAAQAPTGQRFCRSCGLKLDLIVDAMEGRQVQFDFETLKGDLRTLGESLRGGLENFTHEVKQTSRLGKEAAKQRYNHDWIGNLAERGGQVGADLGMALGGYKTEQSNETRADRKLKQALAKKLPATRKYSLQQGVLQVLSGAASASVWYAMLGTMANSGFLTSLEQLILHKTNAPIYGIAQILHMLWLFGLIPVATGLGHLVNGLFFAAKPEDLRLDIYQQPQVAAVQPAALPFAVAPPSAVPTNELERDLNANQPVSVTEEETRRLAGRNAQAS